MSRRPAATPALNQGLACSSNSLLARCSGSWESFFLICTASVLVACGGQGASRGATTATVETPPQRVTSSEPAAPEVGPMTISRPQLLAVLDAGFGRFLQGIATEPALEGNAFAGFRVVAFAPTWLADRRGVRAALRPTDVITQVNGLPIERPEQAFRAFEALRAADALTLTIKRDGVEDTLRVPIVGDAPNEVLDE